MYGLDKVMDCLLSMKSAYDGNGVVGRVPGMLAPGLGPHFL